jgi:hypothetical protein
MTFAALLTAVGCARLFVKYTLHNWRIGREQIETAELLASELVMNAVKSTGICDPSPAYSALKHLNLIHVRLLLFDGSVVLEVWDTDPQTAGYAGADARWRRRSRLVPCGVNEPPLELLPPKERRQNRVVRNRPPAVAERK